MSSDEDIEKPPERRAPSGRASKGNRMAKLIAEEVDEEEEGDAEFYQQEFWAEDAEDEDFGGADADDEDAADSFDSDFGDSTESSSDDDEEKPAKREKAVRKKSVYQDPKAKAKPAEGGEGAGSSSAPRPKKSHKRARSEVEMLGGDGPTRGSMRASTKSATEAAAAHRKQVADAAKARAERAGGKKPGVEMRRLTQEEILEEAKHTEIINRASLEKMLRVEEEKRKARAPARPRFPPRARLLLVRSTPLPPARRPASL